MKRHIILLLVLALVAGALAAPAAAGKRKKKRKKPRRVERVAEGTYDAPALGVGGVATTSTLGGGVEFPLAPGEAFVDIEIADDSGTPVYASLSQDTDPSTPSWEIFTGFCGSTEEPVEVTPGLSLRVTITAGPGAEDPSCAGVATAGTVKATISNLPPKK